MNRLFNSYQRMISPTGKSITVNTDYGLFTSNPWKYIGEAGIRYRTDASGKRIMEKSKNGSWDPINVEDEEYWDNYINQVEQKAVNIPERNYFQYTWDRITGKPVKKTGGRLAKINGKLVNLPK